MHILKTNILQKVNIFGFCLNFGFWSVQGVSARNEQKKKKKRARRSHRSNDACHEFSPGLQFAMTAAMQSPNMTQHNITIRFAS